MWNGNLTTFGLCSNGNCMCHTAMVPCLYTNLSSTGFLNKQSAPESTVYGFSHASDPVNPLFHVENDLEAGQQIPTNEIDSWLLPNPYNNQIHRPMNLTSYGSWPGSQDYGRPFDDMQTQGIQSWASLQQTRAGIIPEATFSAINFPQELSLNLFSFSPFHFGNLVEQIVGILSNPTITSPLDTKQQNSKDGDLKSSSQFDPISRKERILRYLKKKKSRKYEKKVMHSSRKTYARTRPRVHGRFARVIKTDANHKNNCFD